MIQQNPNEHPADIPLETGFDRELAAELLREFRTTLDTYAEFGRVDKSSPSRIHRLESEVIGGEVAQLRFLVDLLGDVDDHIGSDSVTVPIHADDPVFDDTLAELGSRCHAAGRGNLSAALGAKRLQNADARRLASTREWSLTSDAFAIWTNMVESADGVFVVSWG